MPYNALYKPNQIIYGEGVSTVIVTGWSDPKKISTKINWCHYAAIGSLFSPVRGLSFLLRNLLANPQIRYVLALKATVNDTNSGSVDALTSFFKDGFSEKLEGDKKIWVTANGKGLIDYEIERDVLEILRDNILYYEFATVEDLVKFLESDNVNKNLKLQPWSKKPLIYPEPIIETKILPGNRYGHIVRGETVAETWVKLIQRIRKTGTIRPTGYDGKWQELIDLVAIVRNEPLDFYFPEPNYLPIDREYLKNYIPQILEDAEYDYDGKVKYTYGQRLRSWFYRDQIEDVIEKLIGEIDSASAVMNLWDSGRGFNREISTAPFGRLPGDSDHQHGGSPCLNHIWLRVVEGELSLTATFRSNDMFSAWAANAMGLIALQRQVRDEIANRSDYDLKLGPLITVSQSAHIYDDCWENADNLIKNQYHKIISNRQYDDPVGQFIIEIIDGEIIVVQQNLLGETVEFYKGRKAKKLYQQIAENNPVIETEHALYLGTELKSAEICLFLDKPYIQDK